MNILVISANADAERHLGSLMLAGGGQSRVTLFDPACVELIDVRPFDIIAIDTHAPVTAGALDGKLWPTDEIKPIIRLDLSRLATLPAAPAPRPTAKIAEIAPHLHS